MEYRRSVLPLRLGEAPLVQYNHTCAIVCTHNVCHCLLKVELFFFIAPCKQVQCGLHKFTLQETHIYSTTCEFFKMFSSGVSPLGHRQMQVEVGSPLCTCLHSAI